MKHVQLHGELARLFGEHWELNVHTPAEALRAINANKPGFFKYLNGSEDRCVQYRVMLDEEDIEIERIRGPYGKETFHLVPVIMGAGKGGSIIKTIIGAIITVTAIALAAPTGGQSLWAAETYWGLMTVQTAVVVGTAMMLSGISGILAKSNAPEDSNPAGNKPSYIFNGPVNTIAQGGPVPLGYGELIVGSYVISAGIEAHEYALSAP